MRLKVTKSAKSTRLYAIKSTYDAATQKTSSKIVANLGSAEEVMQREGVDYEGALAWARKQIDAMTKEEKDSRECVMVRFDATKLIDKDVRRKVSVGYLFPLKICNELSLAQICRDCIGDSSITYDIGEILTYLVCGRLMQPASKISTYRWSRNLISVPSFEAHHIYRALEILGEHIDDIQTKLYHASKDICERNDTVLYYDCTNFYFEIEQADEEGLRHHGVSKEHRPNPLVQMGLFMDGSGVPLAFSIWPGNTSEQITMRPLEQTIVDEFSHSRFITCTDAGLSSKANRVFNSQDNRAYITTTSLKKMEEYLQTWALEKSGWHIEGKEKEYNLDECEKDICGFYNTIFYKQRMVKDKDGFEEKLIVTFSFKYREYLASIRESQIERAKKKVEKGAGVVLHKRPNDPDRLIEAVATTKDGEVAKCISVNLDESRIATEAAFDGFYAVVTSLVDEDDISSILNVNKRRWEIEECFRIMKTDFSARPVYLSREMRIKAHFLTCFIALLVYRILEQRLAGRYTVSEILSTIRQMDMVELSGEGWIPAYMRTDITDALHEVFGFHTDTQIVTNRQMRSILTKANNKKVHSTK